MKRPVSEVGNLNYCGHTSSQLGGTYNYYQCIRAHNSNFICYSNEAIFSLIQRLQRSLTKTNVNEDDLTSDGNEPLPDLEEDVAENKKIQ